MLCFNLLASMLVTLAFIYHFWVGEVRLMGWGKTSVIVVLVDML